MIHILYIIYNDIIWYIYDIMTYYIRKIKI